MSDIQSKLNLSGVRNDVQWTGWKWLSLSCHSSPRSFDSSFTLLFPLKTESSQKEIFVRLHAMLTESGRRHKAQKTCLWEWWKDGFSCGSHNLKNAPSQSSWNLQRNEDFRWKWSQYYASQTRERRGRYLHGSLRFNWWSFPFGLITMKSGLVSSFQEAYSLNLLTQLCLGVAWLKILSLRFILQEKRAETRSKQEQSRSWLNSLPALYIAPVNLFKLVINIIITLPRYEYICSWLIVHFSSVVHSKKL